MLVAGGDTTIADVMPMIAKPMANSVTTARRSASRWRGASDGSWSRASTRRRLTVSIECPDHLRTMSFPPLLLLSLVENAVKHGVEPKPGPVSIRIDVVAENEAVTVRVSDDGVGLSASTIGGGVGLQNVREHLRTRYGELAHLDLQSPVRGGTVASITVPRSRS